MAEYASERLAEAGALFADGKQEEALEALNKAVDMMDESEDQWSESDDKEKDAEPGMKKHPQKRTKKTTHQKKMKQTKVGRLLMQMKQMHLMKEIKWTSLWLKTSRLSKLM